jgi:GWxTD domain-containing protein
MRRPALAALLALLALPACGSWKRVGTDTDPQTTSETLSDLLDTQTFYRRIGRLSPTGSMRWVGSVAYAAGPRDSTIAVVGISLQNSMLGFQREGESFVARYTVDLGFSRDGAAPVAVSRQETVRVASFKETQRSDESILFQQTFLLPPGDYTLKAALRDPATGNAGSVEQKETVPGFGAGTFTAPLLVYAVRGRGSLDDTLSLVLNPRGSVLFGGDSLLAYVEGYDFPGPTTLPITMTNQDDSLVFSGSVQFQGGRPVESQVLKLHPDSTALGPMTLAIGDSATGKSTTAVVAFSQAWVVANYDDIAELLRYFGRQAAIDSIRKAPVEERPAMWVRFWHETDPDPSTPENEAFNAYFTRIAIANQRFRTEGIEGWRTDRGEVYVALGEPDETFETQPGQVGGRVLEWVYTNLRLALYFVDENGFGRYRLDPGSRADFMRVLERLRRAE